jgi:hypothetical protein
VNFAAFGVLILVPYYLVRTAGLQGITGGAVLALGASGTVIGSWLAGRFVRHASVGRLALLGIVFVIIGLGAVSMWTSDTPLPSLGLALLVQGCGLGLFQVAYADFVTATLPVAERGVAGSLTMVTRTIGVVAGATGLSTGSAHLEAVALAAGATTADAFLSGFRQTFLCASAVLALLLALSMLRSRVWFGRA